MELARINTPLKRVLIDEGRTQAWLARQIGVHRVQLSRWVHGIHEPADETKAAIAAVLGRTVGELWPGHGDASDHTPALPEPSTEGLAA